MSCYERICVLRERVCTLFSSSVSSNIRVRAAAAADYYFTILYFMLILCVYYLYIEHL